MKSVSGSLSERRVKMRHWVRHKGRAGLLLSPGQSQIELEEKREIIQRAFWLYFTVGSSYNNTWVNSCCFVENIKSNSNCHDRHLNNMILLPSMNKTLFFILPLPSFAFLFVAFFPWNSKHVQLMLIGNMEFNIITTLTFRKNRNKYKNLISLCSLVSISGSSWV